jgi:RNA polymerase sigma-B factor
VLVASDRRGAKRIGSLAPRMGGADDGARDDLILSLAPLARRIARRFGRGAESVDDLEQVALIGLIKAVDRFDPERGTTLPRFAAHFIEGEVRHHLRDNLTSPTVPRTRRSEASQMLRARSRLAAGLGRSPTLSELAAELHRSPGEIDAALMARTALARPRPLQAVADTGDAEAGQSLGEEDRRLDLVAERDALAQVLASLGRRERLAVFLRVAAGLSHRDIARRLGISPRHASRLYERGIERAERAAAGLDRRSPA